MPIQDMNIHSANSIGEKNTSGPIYLRRHIHMASPIKKVN